MISSLDTVCAPASGVGGAVAIVRVSGPSCLSAVDSVAVFRSGNASRSPGGRVKFAQIHCPDGSLLDEVLVAVFRAPHSYTGEDSAEIYCHASSYIVSRILDLLVSAGCRMAEPGEFTQRAFVNGKMDLSQAEAVADVIASSSSVEHRVAMNQMRGGYSSELRGIRDSLLRFSSLLELELDFSEEEVEFADRSSLTSLCAAAQAHCSALADSFRLGNAVKNGVPVAIVGAPNSGKSTLLNALLGDERAIVSDVPGTTRDTVEDVCVTGGVKFRFVDTAGLRQTSDSVEKMGIERSFAALRKARIVLGVVDASAACAAADEAYLRSLFSDGGAGAGADSGAGVDSGADAGVGVGVGVGVGAVAGSDSGGRVLIIVRNKADLLEGAVPGAASGLAAFDDAASGAGSGAESGAGCGAESGAESPALYPEVVLSARSGAGLDVLRGMLVAAAGPLDGSETLVTNARHAAALRAAAAFLSVVLEGLSSGLSAELVAEDLRAAIASLNSILGEDAITPQDTLNSIFSEFCIGK